MKAAGRIARPEHVLFVVWLFELLHMAHPAAAPYPAGAALMVLYMGLALPRLRRQTLVLCGVLAVLAGALAATFGGWEKMVPALERTTIFGAFFGTVMILRATADTRPETARARAAFSLLSPAQQSGGFLMGAYAIGALLVVGAMAVLAPIQPREASEAERRAAAEAALRGMCMAPLWSPFWVAMAVAYQHLPRVPLWQIMAIGVPLSLLGLALAQLLYARETGWRGMARAVAGLGPVLPPVALAAALVTALTSYTSLSTLQSVIVAIPPLCLLALVFQGRRAVKGAAAGVYRGLGSVSGEITLVTIAVVLGRVLEHVLASTGATGWIGGLGLPAWSLIALTVGVMALTALAGIHQLVSITLMLALLVPLAALPELVLMEAALVGWALASMLGISAVSVAAAASMFRVPPERLCFGPNLKFGALFAVAATAILAALTGMPE